MDKTTKIYIGVGLAAAVGVGIYVAKQKADATADSSSLAQQQANAAAAAAAKKAADANQAKINADADARAALVFAQQQADIASRQLAAAQPAVQQLGVVDASKPHQIFVPGAGWVTVQAGGVSSAGHRSRYA